MANDFQLNAEIRQDHGKAVARRLRHADKLPAVIYGAGKEPQSITLEHKDMLTALNNEAVYSHILKLKLSDGKEEQVVLKAIQRHSYKPKLVHVDFLRVSAKDKLTMHVPIHFIGEEEAPGVKAGGVVSKSMTDFEIKCLPSNLPEFIEIDISKLELDHAIHLSDVKLPKGVEFAHAEIDAEHDAPVIGVHMPKVSKADEEADAAEAAASEEAKEQAEGAEEAKADSAEDDKKADDKE